MVAAPPASDVARVPAAKQHAVAARNGNMIASLVSRGIVPTTTKRGNVVVMAHRVAPRVAMVAVLRQAIIVGLATVLKMDLLIQIGKNHHREQVTDEHSI